MGTPRGDWFDDSASTTLAIDAPTAPRVLVAGEHEVAIVSGMLLSEGYSVIHVRDGWAALDHVRTCPVDVALLHRALPGIDGTDLCRLLKRDQDTRLLPVILLLSESGSAGERIDGIDAGADDLIAIPVDERHLIARVRSLARFKRYMNDFEPAASVMTTLATMVETRDRYSEGHCHRMANYAAALGRRIGLSGEDLHVLRRGSFLHDIGMLAVPDAVLLKPDALDGDERALIQSHTIIGESLISNLRSLQSVRTIVRHHHERRDGSGYPDRLRGDEIPLAAQIVGLIDVFEALTCPRPYQQPRSREEALAVLRQQGQNGWHRQDLIDEFGAIVQRA